VTQFNTPALVVDLDRVRRNIARTVAALSAAGVKHRPHIKAHKAVALARLQVAMGATGLTCAKLGEAEVMSSHGFTDLLVANQIIGDDKIARLLHLNRRGRAISCIDSVEGATALSAAALADAQRLPVYLEIDCGGGRCGRRPGADLVGFAQAVAGLAGIEVMGVMTYAGQIYGQTGPDLRATARHEAQVLVEAAAALRQLGLDIRELSGGSSLSLHIAQDLRGLTESRAGNYIFNDRNDLAGGSCQLDDCALTIKATVISRVDPHRAIIDAGSKTLTSDACSYRSGYGLVVEYPDIEIDKLNEEHGYLRLGDQASSGAGLRIGEQVTIVPNHACVLTNLCDEVVTVEDGQPTGVMRIEARGMNR
jgi:D-serine deaminase-like pyridoxal phosphate-dependent protein